MKDANHIGRTHAMNPLYVNTVDNIHASAMTLDMLNEAQVCFIDRGVLFEGFLLSTDACFCID